MDWKKYHRKREKTSNLRRGRGKYSSKRILKWIKPIDRYSKRQKKRKMIHFDELREKKYSIDGYREQDESVQWTHKWYINRYYRVHATHIIYTLLRTALKIAISKCHWSFREVYYYRHYDDDIDLLLYLPENGFFMCIIT